MWFAAVGAGCGVLQGRRRRGRCGCVDGVRATAGEVTGAVAGAGPFSRPGCAHGRACGLPLLALSKTEGFLVLAQGNKSCHEPSLLFQFWIASS